MLNRKRWRKSLEEEEKKSSLSDWISSQLVKINNTLSDPLCIFIVMTPFRQMGETIVLQIYIKPLTGVFEMIQFRPKIFISSKAYTQRPRIYNDRRIFHPNINLYTCEVVFPQLVKDWNPAYEQCSNRHRLVNILKHLKYTILQPNNTFVPNNPYNRKAAVNYHFNLASYPDLILEYCPLYLEDLACAELSNNVQSKFRPMEIEDRDALPYLKDEQFNQSDYWSLKSMTIRKRLAFETLKDEKMDEEEDSLELLSKKIKLISFDEDKKDGSLKKSNDK